MEADLMRGEQPLMQVARKRDCEGSVCVGGRGGMENGVGWKKKG